MKAPSVFSLCIGVLIGGFVVFTVGFGRNVDTWLGRTNGDPGFSRASSFAEEPSPTTGTNADARMASAMETLAAKFPEPPPTLEPYETSTPTWAPTVVPTCWPGSTMSSLCLPQAEGTP